MIDSSVERRKLACDFALSFFWPDGPCFAAGGRLHPQDALHISLPEGVNCAGPDSGVGPAQLAVRSCRVLAHTTFSLTAADLQRPAGHHDLGVFDTTVAWLIRGMETASAGR